VGFKVIYGQDKPPYGRVYKHPEPVLVLAARKGTLEVARHEQPHTESVQRGQTFTLSEGFYTATYKPWGNRANKAYFYVTEDGNVWEFPRAQNFFTSMRKHQRGDRRWAEGFNPLQAEGEEPPRRSIVKRSRFDRLDDEIVPEKPEEDLVKVLNEAMGTPREPEAPPPGKHPMEGLLDEFLGVGNLRC